MTPADAARRCSPAATVALALAMAGAPLARAAAPGSGWKHSAIGTASRCTMTSRNGALVMTCGGTGYGGRSDSLHMARLELKGAFVLTARVQVLEGARRLGAGIMLRESLEPGARSVFLTLHGGGRSEMLSRRFTGGEVIRDRWFGSTGDDGVHWFRLAREGDRIALYDSDDGSRWSMGFRFVIGEGMDLPDLPGRVFAGPAVASGSETESATVRFDRMDVSRPDPPNRTSWFGNTFPAPKSRVNMSADVLTIDPEKGTVYVAGPDEWTGLVAYRARDGRVVNSSRIKPSALAHDGTYLYVAMRDKKKDDYGLRRYGWGAERCLSALMSIHARDGGLDALVNHQGHCRGLAVDRGRGELYVSDTPNDRIAVYDTAGWPRRKREFAAESPHDLAFDGESLWALERGGGAPRVARYSREGRRSVVWIDGEGDARGIAVGPRGRLFVADAGRDSRVEVLEITGAQARMATALGARGGIHSGVPGRVAPGKLNHPQDVGVDAEGNVVVCSEMRGVGHAHLGTGGEMRKFSPAGRMLWERYGLEFVDTGDFDPADPRVVFTKHARYELDYGAPAGEDWRYAAMTVDRRGYPDDVRLHFGNGGGVYVRRIEGRRILYVFDQRGSTMGVYRFERGSEVAVPAGLITLRGDSWREWPADAPEAETWTWVDADGDGAMDAGEFADNGPSIDHLSSTHVDERGGVWSTGRRGRLLHYAAPELSRRGVPLYRPAERSRIGAPFNEPRKLHYDAALDRLYVMGFTDERPKLPKTHFGASGSEVVRYDGWLASGGRARPAARYDVPYVIPDRKVRHGGNQYRTRNLAVHGPHLFVLTCWASAHVYELDGGRELAVLRPGPEVGGWCGLVDTHPGFNVTFHDGAYRVIVEDDIHIKQIVYHWRPGTPRRRTHGP